MDIFPLVGEICFRSQKINFLLKILERIVDREIRSLLYSNNLSASQHAYLKGKSVETALHSVVIEYGLDNKVFTLASFAFNNVTTDAIKTGLIESGADEFLIDWFSFVLENRIINSEMGENTVRRNV